MRYWRLDITSPAGAPLLPSSLKGQKLTSLLPDGKFNPASLNIELDITQSPMHAPTGSSYVRIWGLGLRDLGHAFDLNGANISVFGGMAKGLPLANPAQSGLLAKGMIVQSFGNWVSVDQTLDLILASPTGTADDPLNWVLNWQAGTTLASALTNTFATVYPKAKQNVSISSRLTLNHDEVGHWDSLEQFGGWLFRRSKAIITDPGYPGVNLSYDGDAAGNGTIRVSDFTGPPNPVKQILFRDLIGQPVWIAPLTIQAKVVMRADLDLFDLVSLPTGLVTTTAQAFSRFQDKSSFSGNYQITDIHHYGNARQPDAASWNTTLTMIPEPKNG